MKKTILVTGGAGFVGSHLCERLLAEGNRVICLDNLYSGSRENIAHLLNNPNFEFVRHNVIDPFYRKVDAIYNLACPASPVSYQFDPVYTVKTNIMGALAMLDLARNTGARILQASTSEVYGDPLEHPQKETYWGNVNVASPRACYDEGKRAAETLFYDHAREYGIDIRVVRIFNTYGPRMAVNDGRAVSNFIVQALRGEDITVYGKGNQTRSFLYIDDLINGLVAMMEHDDFQGPVNLGNPNEISIAELANKILIETGSRSRIIYRDALTNDPQKRNPDIALAKEKFGFAPKTDVTIGVQKTVAYFRERLRKKTHVAVFTTAYKPLMGPAEEYLQSVIAQMPHIHFHIITGKFKRGLPSKEEGKNHTIYRIGMGSSADKYLLPFLGLIKAAPDAATAKKARMMGRGGMELISVQSSLEASSIKETFYKITNKMEKKLHVPR
ncbi:SDR family oxidoreductase [Candidatus Azambacteria bacterium]|nr:SDR family oxidoreductase [Candidatus Azambacteria bacterium]